MDRDLISKKELLEITGITYGQLYRWKRKNLIPEEWFIRKSTYTGQEAFFPRDKILSRIRKIQHMKGDLSLDELADVFSPNPKILRLKREELLERGIASKPVLDFFIKKGGDIGTFPFDKILQVYLLEKMLQNGEINFDEGAMVLQTLEDHYARFEGRNCELVFIRKIGMSTCMLVSSNSEIYFEKNARVVSRISLSGCIEELKLKVM